MNKSWHSVHSISNLQRIVSALLVWTTPWMFLLLWGCDWITPSPAPDKLQLPQPVTTAADDSELYEARPVNTAPPRTAAPQTADQTRLRLQLLEAEMQQLDAQTVHHALSDVPSDAAMLIQLKLAAQVVDDIYLLQVHGSNLIWREQIAQSGDPVESAFFARFRRPWCPFSADIQCNAVAALPPQKTGTVYWPTDFGKSDYAQMLRMINARELQSPYGLVTRDGQTRLKVVSYVEDTRFSSLFGALSQAFALAAAAASDNTAKEGRPLLESLSQVTRQGDIGNFGIDERIQEGHAGQWRIYFGGYSTALDPFHTKRAFGLHVGKIHDVALRRLQQLSSQWSEMSRRYLALFEGAAPRNAQSVLPEMVPLDSWLTAGYWGDIAALRDNSFDSSAVASEGEHWLPGVLFLQEYVLPRRQLAIALFGQTAAQAIADEQWVQGLGASSAAKLLVPREVWQQTAEGEVRTSLAEIAGKGEAVVSEGIRRTGAFWVLRNSHQIAPMSNEELQNSVAALLTELVYDARGAASSRSRAAKWLLTQLRLQGGLEVFLTPARLRFDAAKCVATSAGVFERIISAVSTMRGSEIPALFADAPAPQTAESGSEIERFVEAMPATRPVAIRTVLQSNER